jgi:hypothetical protein
MPRIRGNAAVVLEELQTQIGFAKRALAEVEAEYAEVVTRVEVARAELHVHQAIYEGLAARLAPQPRQSSSKSNSGMARAVGNSLKPANRSAKKARKKRGVITGDSHGDGEAVKPVLCGACGNVEDYEDHAQPSPHYHPFESSVRGAAGQSSTNGREVVLKENEQGEVLVEGAHT